MNSREYWQERERKALRERIKEEQSYIRRVNGIHDDMLDQIQKEIDSFYQRYAIKEHISLAEAKKRVSQLDIKAYEEKARRYVEDKDLSPQANREMRLYNLTMKVNRLEMLKARIGMAMVDSFDGMNNFYEEVLSKRAMDEYERQAGILGKSVINPEKKAKALVNASFKGATGKYGFSDVLWTQQTFMKAELSKLLEQGIMQGKGPRELAPQLQKIFGVEKYACERLMRTELARVQIEAQRQSFEENGYDEYQFITLSSAPFTKSKVCPICADLNGKHFKVKDMEIGENAPPMHPNCRCSVAAYMDPGEFEKWLDAQSGKHVGLGAGETDGIVKPHDPPKFVGKVDFNDEKAVQKLIDDFERTAVNKDIETARVICKNGEVYDCFGVSDAVYPDTDLGEKIRGGIITHAHPISETAFSFSKGDMQLFQDYSLKRLRGCDKKYIYEFSRNKMVDEAAGINWMEYEHYQHVNIIRHANKYGIGYRRWKNV